MPSKGTGLKVLLFGLTVSSFCSTLGVKHLELRVWRLSAKCGFEVVSKEEQAMNISRLLIGGFLIAHGLVHAMLAVVPNPDVPNAGLGTLLPGWVGSWLLTRLGLSESVLKSIATLLSVVATVGFVVAGLALFGILVPHDWWRMIAVASAAVSLLLYVLFWHRYFIVAPLLDVAILVALLWAHWPPEPLVGS